MAHLVNNEFVLVILGDALQILQAIFSELHGISLGGHLCQRKMDVLV